MRRTARRNLRFEFVSCACTDCGFRHFAGIEAPRRIQEDPRSQQMALLLSFAECPRCGNVGAEWAAFSCNFSDSCPHPEEQLRVQIHEGEYAAVCLRCGERRHGGNILYAEWERDGFPKEEIAAVVRGQITKARV